MNSPWNVSLIFLATLIQGNLSTLPIPINSKTIGPADFCASPPVQGCLPQLMNMIQNYKKITVDSPTSLQEIKQICRFIKPLTLCTSLSVLECIITSKSLAVYIADTFSEFNYSYNQFCHSRDFQKAYLKHTPCYDNRVQGECSPILKKFFSQLNDPTLIQTLVQDQILDEKDLIKGCCLLKNFLHCIASNMIEKCGNESKMIIDVIWERLFTPLMVKHCSAFTIEWCPSSTSVSLSSSPSSSSLPSSSSSVLSSQPQPIASSSLSTTIFSTLPVIILLTFLTFVQTLS